MSGAASAVRDLLSLLHEEWMPEDRKEVIKQLMKIEIKVIFYLILQEIN